MSETWRPQIGEYVRYYDTDVCKDKVGKVLAYDARLGSYPYTVSDPEAPGEPWEMALGELEPEEGPDAA